MKKRTYQLKKSNLTLIEKKLPVVQFTIGVQTFSLSRVDTKKDAVWFKKMLNIAFRNLIKHSKQKIK